MGLEPVWGQQGAGRGLVGLWGQGCSGDRAGAVLTERVTEAGAGSCLNPLGFTHLFF